MRNAIRCCISCILPCGALDVIRIVHSDGRVEEISGGNVSASLILDAYPKHVLKKPSSRCPDDNDSATSVPRIMVVPPDAQLKRGNIYFLIPVSTSEKSHRSKKNATKMAPVASRRKQSPGDGGQNSNSNNINNSNSNSNSNNGDSDSAGSLSRMMKSERYLREVMREKVSTQKERRRGRVGVWRPHLESISESSSATSTTSDHQ